MLIPDRSLHKGGPLFSAGVLVVLSPLNKYYFKMNERIIKCSISMKIGVYERVMHIV